MSAGVGIGGGRGQPAPEIHEVCSLIPEMSEEEYEELKKDIQAHGLLEPIALLDGKVIDGRHRLRACQELGIEPRFRELPKDTDPAAFVLSENLRRRHLTPEQKAAVAVEAEAYRRAKEEAKKREKMGAELTHAKLGRRTNQDMLPPRLGEASGAKTNANPSEEMGTQIFEYPSSGEAAEQISKLVDVNRQYVYDAQRIRQQAPDVFDALKSGHVTIPVANELLKLPEGARAVALEEARKAGRERAMRAVKRVVHSALAAEHIEALSSNSATIGRLLVSGRSPEEIVGLGLGLGFSEGEVAEVAERLERGAPEIRRLFFVEHRPVPELARQYGLDEVTTWAIVLEGKDDLERLRILSDGVPGLNCMPRPYDVWNFADAHRLFGYEYPGHVPGQLILQLLYFYTRQGDLVVDPMAGSGTTIDACLLMGRRYLAFDVNPEAARRRPEIQTKDAIEAMRSLGEGEKGLPLPDLVFLDPPYFKKKEEEYGAPSVSSLSREEYLDYFSRLAREIAPRLSARGRVALLMSDYTEDDPHRSGQGQIFIHHYIERFEREGFAVERIIQAPLSTQQIHPDFQIKFTEERKLARLARYLVVFNAPQH